MSDFPSRGRRIRDMSSARFRRLGIEQLECRALMAAGQLDPSFGEQGIVMMPAYSDEPTYDDLSDIALQPDGKIVAAGNSRGGRGYIGALTRLSETGSL